MLRDNICNKQKKIFKKKIINFQIIYKKENIYKGTNSQALIPTSKDRSPGHGSWKYGAILLSQRDIILFRSFFFVFISEHELSQNFPILLMFHFSLSFIHLKPNTFMKARRAK